MSSRYSCRITHSSITTPTATKKVNAHTECSQGGDEFSRVLISLSKADMALSSAEIELSKTEASVGRLEAAWIKGAKITIIVLLRYSRLKKVMLRGGQFFSRFLERCRVSDKATHAVRNKVEEVLAIQ